MSGQLERTFVGLVSSTSENVAVIQLQNELHYGDKKLTHKPYSRTQQFGNLNCISNVTDTLKQEQLLEDTCCTTRRVCLLPTTPSPQLIRFEIIVVARAMMF
jgi:hypothetical protein